MDARQWRVRHFRALLCRGHIALQPGQTDGVMETVWVGRQPSASPAGSIILMGPQSPVLPQNHSTASGQSNTTKPHLSFSSSFLGSIHPVGFASRWQATPGRGPGQPHLAAELLGPVQRAERSPPALLPLPCSSPHLHPNHADVRVQ